MYKGFDEPLNLASVFLLFQVEGGRCSGDHSCMNGWGACGGCQPRGVDGGWQ